MQPATQMMMQTKIVMVLAEQLKMIQVIQNLLQVELWSLALDIRKWMWYISPYIETGVCLKKKRFHLSIKSSYDNNIVKPINPDPDPLN